MSELPYILGIAALMWAQPGEESWEDAPPPQANEKSKRVRACERTDENGRQSVRIDNAPAEELT